MNETTQNVPATVEQRSITRERFVVQDPIAVLDTARFEQMQRVAMVMSRSSLIPEALYMTGPKERREMLPDPTVMANCFLVVNQAVRWGMDPFAVAQCVSVIHGKLVYEGKLIASVLDTRLGIKLEYDIVGDGEQMQVIVRGVRDGQVIKDSNGQAKIVKGTVAEWKTAGSGSPWEARGGRPRMLRYRGAREWCRVHEPAIMLGVYSDDEMEDLTENARAERARPVQVRDEATPPQQQLQRHPAQESLPKAPAAPQEEQRVTLPPMQNTHAEAAHRRSEPFFAKDAGKDFMPPAQEQPQETIPPDQGQQFDNAQWLIDIDAGCKKIVDDPTKEISDIATFQQEHINPMNGKVPADTFKKATIIAVQWVKKMMEDIEKGIRN